MAAGPFVLVNNAIEKIVDGTINLATDTFVGVIITAAHTAAVTDDTWSDISASEASGAGYTSGGATVGPLTVSRVGAVVTVDATSDLLFSTATLAGKYAYILRRAGGSLTGTDLIVGYMDLNAGGGNLSSVGADFEVTWPIDGLLTLTRA